MRAINLFVFVSLLLLLSSCIKRQDAIAPLITIVSPANGSVQNIQRPIVRGYAMDDEGVESIIVNGQDLLKSELLKNERGKKLINFAFEPQNQGEGSFAANIEVVDINGRSSLFPYELLIDQTPPTVELIELTNLGGNRIRVHGIAKDNDFVNSISIAGTSILFRPSKEYQFKADVDKSSDMTLVVKDNAGNITSLPLNP